MPQQWTAIHWAALNGHYDVTMALIASRADVNCRTVSVGSVEEGSGSSRYIDIIIAASSFKDGTSLAAGTTFQ
jgi:ankyrin repeat protein